MYSVLHAKERRAQLLSAQTEIVAAAFAKRDRMWLQVALSTYKAGFSL